MQLQPQLLFVVVISRYSNTLYNINVTDVSIFIMVASLVLEPISKHVMWNILGLFNEQRLVQPASEYGHEQVSTSMWNNGV